jgi:hypothetical protein
VVNVTRPAALLAYRPASPDATPARLLWHYCVDTAALRLIMVLALALSPLHRSSSIMVRRVEIEKPTIAIRNQSLPIRLAVLVLALPLCITCVVSWLALARETTTEIRAELYAVFGWLHLFGACSTVKI